MIALIDSDIYEGHINNIGYFIYKGEYLHRYIAERALGRKLKSDEHVHHVDYDKLNNHPSNLVICKNNYHKLLHARTDTINAGFDPNTHLRCSHCKTYHPKSDFYTNPNKYSGYSNNCNSSTSEYKKRKGLNKSKFDWWDRLQQQYRRVAKSYTKREISWLTKEDNLP